MTSLAENREQHIQRFHEQMESWQQEMERVRSLAYSANSYLQGEMNKLVAQLDKGLQQLTSKLVQLAETGDKRVYTALESMESAWTSLKSTIGDVSHRMREKGEHTGDRIGDKAREARDNLRDTVDQGMDQARHAVNQGKEAVRDAVQRGSDSARDMMDKGKDALRDTAEQAREAMPSGGKRGQAGSQATGGATQTEETVVVSRSRTPQQH